MTSHHMRVLQKMEDDFMFGRYIYDQRGTDAFKEHMIKLGEFIPNDELTYYYNVE